MLVRPADKRRIRFGRVKFHYLMEFIRSQGSYINPQNLTSFNCTIHENVNFGKTDKSSPQAVCDAIREIIFYK